MEFGEHTEKILRRNPLWLELEQLSDAHDECVFNTWNVQHSIQ